MKEEGDLGFWIYDLRMGNRDSLFVIRESGVGNGEWLMDHGSWRRGFSVLENEAHAKAQSVQREWVIGNRYSGIGIGKWLDEINSTVPVPVWYIWRAKPTKESLTHAN